ncbi:MAG: hypothetical protein KA780_10440 [Prolixibacteraceae bacterium]|nr:hypothetical protein [Prolixibacteraceae bacterium]
MPGLSEFTGKAGLIRVHRESGGLAMVSMKGGSSVQVWQNVVGLPRSSGKAGLIRVHWESGGLAMVSRNGGGSVTGLAECGRPATGTGKVASLLLGRV